MKRAKKVLSIDKKIDRIRRKIYDADSSMSFLETRLKSAETGIDSIRDFDAKEAFLLAAKHIATHQELRAPLLSLVDAINRLTDGLRGRSGEDVSSAVKTLSTISIELMTLAEAIGPIGPKLEQK
jgi:hypothetical protein